MCLQKLDIKKTRKLQKSKRTFTVYKLLTSNNYSIFKPYHYELGINKSDRKSRTLEKYELEEKKVYEGLHVFANKRSAIKYNNGMYRIIKIYGKSHDLIGSGKWNDKTCYVFTKLEVRSFENIDPNYGKY